MQPHPLASNGMGLKADEGAFRILIMGSSWHRVSCFQKEWHPSSIRSVTNMIY